MLRKLTIWVEESEMKKFKGLAKASRVKVKAAHLIRVAMAEYLERQEKK